MPVPLFQRIIDQLSDIGFSGRLSYQFYNEPLLRDDLEELVAIAKANVPTAFQVLYTNGDHLTPDRYDRLLCAGIDHFLVTRHGWEEFPERACQTVQFPNALDISNRGGFFRTIAEPLRRPCFATWEMMIVTVTGEVVLCHEDARRTTVIGSLARGTIADVWFGSEISILRSKLAQGDRAGATAICSGCDHRGYPGPNMTI
jgi:2-deoxy-scyllo-inosamine dehydrogenase (SAM-dependent)